MNDQQLSVPEGLELREIAPPLPVRDLGDFLFHGGLLAVAVMVVVLSAWVLVRRARRPRFPALPPEPAEMALRDLGELRSRADAMPTDEAASRASRVIRTFLHRRYGMLASFATSGELAGRGGAEEPPPPPDVVPLVDCLAQLDSLRFGVATGADSEFSQLLRRAMTLLGAGQGDGVGAGGGGAAAGGMGTIDRPYDLGAVTRGERGGGDGGEGEAGGRHGVVTG